MAGTDVVAVAPAVVPAHNPIYEISVSGSELKQSEIISDIIQYIFDPVSDVVTEIVHPYVIVASQDCDLLWDYASFEKDGSRQLNEVLLYEAHTSASIRPQMPGGDVWRRAKQNKDDRYHVLQSSTEHQDLEALGVPDLTIDFKRFFL